MWTCSVRNHSLNLIQNKNAGSFNLVAICEVLAKGGRWRCATWFSHSRQPVPRWRHLPTKVENFRRTEKTNKQMTRWSLMQTTKQSNKVHVNMVVQVGLHCDWNTKTLKQQLCKLARKQINKQTSSNLANKQMKVCKSEWYVFSSWINDALLQKSFKCVLIRFPPFE